MLSGAAAVYRVRARAIAVEPCQQRLPPALEASPLGAYNARRGHPRLAHDAPDQKRRVALAVEWSL